MASISDLTKQSRLILDATLGWIIFTSLKPANASRFLNFNSVTIFLYSYFILKILLVHRLTHCKFCRKCLNTFSKNFVAKSATKNVRQLNLCCSTVSSISVAKNILSAQRSIAKLPAVRRTL